MKFYANIKKNQNYIMTQKIDKSKKLWVSCVPMYTVIPFFKKKKDAYKLVYALKSWSIEYQ